MTLAKFLSVSGAIAAYTTEPDGGNLPRQLGPWTFQNLMSINVQDDRHRTIAAEVERRGYALRPATRPGRLAPVHPHE